MDLVQRLKLIGNISLAAFRQPANLAEIGQVVTEILKILVNPRWRLNRHLGSSSKAKAHSEHFLWPHYERRLAKYGRNRLSRAGDIKDLSKFHFGSRFK